MLGDGVVKVNSALRLVEVLNRLGVISGDRSREQGFIVVYFWANPYFIDVILLFSLFNSYSVMCYDGRFDCPLDLIWDGFSYNL